MLTDIKGIGNSSAKDIAEVKDDMKEFNNIKNGRNRESNSRRQ